MIGSLSRSRGVVARLMTALAVMALLVLGAVAPVTAAAPSPTTGIDVSLPLGHRIAGTVTDADGHPVSGADIFTSSDDGASGNATTGADGSYIVHALPDGTYRLHVDPPADGNYLEHWYGSASSDPDGVDAVPIQIAGADVAGIDVILESGVTMSGTIRDSDGHPLAGLTIAANGDVGRSAISDGSGAYTIGGLVAGSYSETVVPPDGSDFVYGPVVDGNVGLPEDDATQVDVGPAGLTGQDIVARRGFRMTGKVTWARGGQIEVRALGPSGGTALTDATGHFVIHGLLPGEYTVDFIQPVPPLSTETGSFGLGTYMSQVEIVDADVALTPTFLPRGTDIVGTVTSPSGKGLADAYLSVCDAQGAIGCAFVHGGPTGKFRVVDVPTGDFIIWESVPDHVQGYLGAHGWVIDHEQAMPIHVVRGGPDVGGITVIAPEGATISGRITGPNGDPVPGATVMPSNTGTAPNTRIPTTDATGRYVIRGLATNQYRVNVGAPTGSDLLYGYYAATEPGHFTFDFDTATPVRAIEAHDRTAPFVSVRDPAAGATGVPVDGQLSVRFSEPVVNLGPTTVSVRDVALGTLVAVDLSFVPEDRILTLVPQQPLRPDARYRVVLDQGIQDWSGNHLARTSWTFRTSP